MLKNGALATATFTFTAAPLSAPPTPTPTVQTVGCSGQAPSFPTSLTQGEGRTFYAWGFQPGSTVTLTITGASPVTAIADSACQVSQRVLTSMADLPGQYTITASGPKAGGGTQTATLTFVLRAASLPGNVAVLPPQVVPPGSGQVIPPAFSIPVVPPSTSGQTPPNSIAGRPPLPANPFGPQGSGGQSNATGQLPAGQGQPPVAGSDPAAPPSAQSTEPSPASGAGGSALGEMPAPGSIPGVPPIDPAATGGSDPMAGSSPFIPPVTMPTLDPNMLTNLDAKMREMEEEAKKKAAEEDETDAVLFSAYFHGLLIMNMAEGLGLTVSDLDATALAECAVVLKRGGVDPESDQYTIAFTLCYRAETAE
jgi:hypothetical protein